MRRSEGLGRRAGGAAAAALVAGALVASWGAALAEASHKQPLFSFGSFGSEGGQLIRAFGMAVNETGAGGVAPGTTYISEEGNNRVQSLDAEGSFIGAWGWDVTEAGEPGDIGEGFEICEAAEDCKMGASGKGPGQFSSSSGVAVAVDQSSGDVYAIDSGNSRVERFSAVGTFIGAWGSRGSGIGQFVFDTAIAGIGIDEAGDVYVADKGNRRVQKFDSEGNFLAEGGEGGAGPGQFAEGTLCCPNYLSVSPVGDVFVVGRADGTIYHLDSSLSFLEEYPATAGPSEEQPARNALAFDRAAETLLFAKRDVGKIFELDPETGTIVHEYDALGEEWTGLGINSTTGRFYGADGLNASQVWVWDEPCACVPVINPPELHSWATATLKGIVDPEGAPIKECFFIWGRTQGYGNKAPCDQSPAEIGEGSEPVPVSADIAGLGPNGAEHHARLVAIGEGYARSEDEAFRSPEVVFTEPPGGLEGTGATLNGEVDPFAAPLTECAFEYGRTTAYGSEVPCAESPAEIGASKGPVAVHAEIGGLDPATDYHFRLRAANALDGPARGADEALRTLGPEVTGSWAQDVGIARATLAAKVRPEGKATTYRFQYGTQGPCGPNPCAATGPLGPVGPEGPVHRVSATIEGLQPDATYHWRVIATNPDAQSEGPEKRLDTYAPIAHGPCPNDALRVPPSAALPDCRAYEMVSPVDKNGGDIIASVTTESDSEGAYRQASRDGERLTYTSTTAFGDAVRSTRSNQYLSGRGAGGWATHALYPPQGTTVFDPNQSSNYDLNTNFQAFTPDLCRALMRDHNLDPLTPDAIAEFTNLYLRENCGPGADRYRALTIGGSPPFSAAGEELNLQARAYSADMRLVLFQATAALTTDALREASGGRPQLYAWSAESQGRLRLASVLTSGEADPASSFVGSVGTGGLRFAPARSANLAHAVSPDGSRVFWSSSSGAEKGFVYVRTNPGEAQSALANGGASGTGTVSVGSYEVTGLTTETGEFAAGQKIYGVGIPRGTTIASVGAGRFTLSAAANEGAGATPLVSSSECTQPARACTVPVSPGGEGTVFWAVSADGSKAIYAEGGGLYELDVDRALAGEDADAVSEIAARADGIAGASENVSRLYFVSEEDLAPGTEEGEKNLYLGEQGAIRFIAPLTGPDLSPYSADDPFPVFRPSRVSADGRRLAFMSAAPLTGHDNADRETGEPVAQVFLYDAEANGSKGRLLCVSCNPSGGRPSADAPPTPYTPGSPASFPAAAWLPTCEWSNYCKRTLADGGNRLFFNAYDSLVPEDTNEAQDVYQWEAPGTGTCTKADPRYFPRNGGCIHLLSTGKSTEGSEFLDASASGDDAFLTTASDIDPRDLAFIDVYDARVNGGFPPPEREASACVGDACQSVPPAPEAPAPASRTYTGPGNPVAARGGCAGPARRAKALARKAKRVRRAAKRSDSARRSRRLRRRARTGARKAKRLSRKAKRCRRGRAGGR